MRALHPLLDITRKSPLGLVESPFLVCRDPQNSSAKHGKFSWKQPVILMWFCLLDVWNDLHPLVFSDVFCQHSQSCVTLCYNIIYIYICSVSSHNLVLHACNLGRATLLQWSSLSCDRMRLVKLYINSSRQQQKVFARVHPLKRTVTGYTHHHPSPARFCQAPKIPSLMISRCFKFTVKQSKTYSNLGFPLPTLPKTSRDWMGICSTEGIPKSCWACSSFASKVSGLPNLSGHETRGPRNLWGPSFLAFFWKETQQMRELVVA